MSIKKTKLTVAELCQLNAELNSEKGLLSQVLPMVFKYHLSKIAKIAADEDVSVNTLRDDAIRASGDVTADGGFSIPQLIDVMEKKKVTKMPNPTFVKFAGEMEALFSQEKEIEHEEFFITDLKNVESGGTFSVFKLLEA
jgi:hypothetical protein